MITIHFFMYGESLPRQITTNKSQEGKITHQRGKKKEKTTYKNSIQLLFVAKTKLRV